MNLSSITNYRLSLRHFNNFLTAIVIALSTYMILFPFLPYLELWRNSISDETGGVRYQGILAAESGQADNQNLSEPPQDNRLVLPSISLNEEVIVGDNPNLVHLGAWHRPNTSTPDKGGNTVIVGHRFSYSSPATFYHLDKIKSGDKFAIWWEGKEYVYKVFETKIVPATAIEIERNTDKPIATLYTCTPIWTATNRLVVRAELINQDRVNQDEI